MAPSPKKFVDKANDKKKKKKDKEEAVADSAGPPPPPPMPGDDFTLPTREVLKPPNQMQLTEAAMEEELARMLTANNPAAPSNVARFNMKERCYKFEPMVEQTMSSYTSDGYLLFKGSEDAKKQLDTERLEAEAAGRFQAELDKASHDKKDGDGDAEAPDDSRQLRNQFNFSERAAQTYNYPMRDRATFTEPPPTATVEGSCTQWEIYDEYAKDLERQKQEELMKQKGSKKGNTQSSSSKTADADVAEAPVEVMHSKEMSTALQILDRMVNQNMFEEIAMDFKYWEDASDAFRQGEGTLLPLWKFYNDKARKKHITTMCWNPLYWDMFAVGYGSYDFLKQGSGLICMYSLKNPSHPEYTFNTESGVMSLHFHPEFANLLAVGCYDGTVMVFDVRGQTQTPIYQATVKTGKHSEPVWQVFWQVDEMQKALQFVSISSDGRVTLWTLSKSELVPEEIMKLKLQKLQQREDDAAVQAVAGGVCMDFNKGAGQDHIYVVGTEEGFIHKCSKAYSSEYLSTYQGHHMGTYAVKWNYIHTRMFLSASADWTVNLWDSMLTDQPAMSFNLNTAVGDVAWAPYSATVFAAVTDDGKVHVYDLHQNKLTPLCSQKVVKKAKLTKLVFNPKHPIMLVGDDRGCVTALKLSPNLRHSSKPEKGQKFEELECAKLDRVIEVAKKSHVSEDQ